ncbi:uncharacterized protein LOC112344581 [Selaginella moellendorffii]|uniref:uncharacterized protein LOC112344581 n=1 Tax=Selaginella moellendorffii TaxID=88036 RepID=UPI000D1C5308|nr:uncharacterized protein LOC112344581 [Selaginella moellendorffii]|eukprot:XP_024525337.1 uncharacterized protein LOC112344581 [Selaginella moellendorffii]
MEYLDALQTLASCSSPAPASAIARRNLRCVSSRGRRSPASIRLHLVEFQQSLQRSRIVAAVFLSSEVRATARPRRGGRRKKAESQDGDVELEIFKFMEQSGKPNTFPTKEELFAAGRGDLVEAAVRKGGWLTVGWDFQRPSSSGSDLTQEKFEIHVNGSRKKKDRASKNGSSDSDEQHLMRLNGQTSQSFPAKGILVHGSNPVESSCPANDGPSYIRNGKGRRHPRKTTSTLAEIDKATTDGPELNAEASHERWRRKRRKKTTSIAADNSTSVKNALSWIHDMVQKREQWILESRSRPSKQRSSETPPADITPAERESSPLSRSDDGSSSSRVSRSSSRIFPAELPARGSLKGNSLRPFSTVPSSTTESPETSDRSLTSSSPSKTGQDIRTPAPLTRTSSRVYSTGASALSKKSSSCAASFSSTTETGGSNSFNSRLQKLETKLLATRAALKSGRATLLKGEDKLLQVGTTKN